MKTKRSTVSRMAVAFVFLALILAAGAGALEASRCGDALRSCLNDPLNQIMFTGVAYCLNGYYFCVKFIER